MQSVKKFVPRTVKNPDAKESEAHAFHVKRATPELHARVEVTV